MCHMQLNSWWTWWHQMETFSTLLAICAGNSLVTAQWPVTQCFDVFFDLSLNKRLNKQSWGWWFEMPPCPLWFHYNDLVAYDTLLAQCFYKILYISSTMHLKTYTVHPCIYVVHDFFFFLWFGKFDPLSIFYWPLYWYIWILASVWVSNYMQSKEWG